jgi:hypothetical protein
MQLKQTQHVEPYSFTVKFWDSDLLKYPMQVRVESFGLVQQVQVLGVLTPTTQTTIPEEEMSG